MLSFSNQQFQVPARKTTEVVASIALRYKELGLEYPLIRLSPVFIAEKPWTLPRDLGRKPLREVEGLLRPFRLPRRTPLN